MEVTAEDLQYPPYKDHRLGRIFTPSSPENIKLFREEFRASELGARLKSEGLDHSDNLVLILSTAQTELDKEDVNMQEYTATARRLYMLGDLRPKPRPVAQAPALPPLTEPQIRWSEYREFSERSTSAQCTARAKVDAGYASFMQKNYERELNQPIGDAVVNLNQKAPLKKTVPEELRQFASEYRTLSSEQCRRLMSPGSNPDGYQEWSRKFEASCAAGLI